MDRSRVCVCGKTDWRQIDYKYDGVESLYTTIPGVSTATATIACRECGRVALELCLGMFCAALFIPKQEEGRVAMPHEEWIAQIVLPFWGDFSSKLHTILGIQSDIRYLSWLARTGLAPTIPFRDLSPQQQQEHLDLERDVAHLTQPLIPPPTPAHPDLKILVRHYPDGKNASWVEIRS